MTLLSTPPARISIALARDVAMEFQWIPPGEFMMGAYGEWEREEPQHLVRITQGFYLGVYPVTQREFAVWTKSTQVDHKNHFAGRDDHPAENLNWHEAMSFCRWLNDSHGGKLPCGFTATLPTEAQWEYACRAGTETEYYTGNGEAALSEAGWFETEATHPVGKKAPNAWGLYDMHGNVDEWCLDEWDADVYKKRLDGVPDPCVGTVDGGSGDRDRVVRGGSWGNGVRGCRSAFRFRYWAGFRNRYHGFRACLGLGLVASRAPGTVGSGS